VWDASSATSAAQNIPSLTVYDADSQPVESILPPAAAGEVAPVTLSAFDNMGRVTSVTANDIAGGGTSAPDVNLTTTYAFDGLSRQTSVTDQAGIVTAYAYDRLGRVILSTLNLQGMGTYDPAYPDRNVRAKFAYDTLGELIGTCQPQQVYGGSCDPTVSTDAHAWHYAYDAFGNLDVQTPPVNATLTHLSVREWTYDAGNRLTSVCDRSDNASPADCTQASRKTDLTYDNVGRATVSKTYLPVSTLKVRTVATYDATSARTKLERFLDGSSTADDTLTFTYDDLTGRETAVKRSTTTLTGLTWNVDGTLASRTDDGISGSSAFSYDRQDRLVSMTSPLFTGSATFGWRADGLLTSRAWPSNNTATVTYDGLKRPTAFTESTTGGQQALFSQAYDRAGNMVTEGRTLSGISGSAGSGDQTFAYDAVHRVSSATLAGVTQSYTYDPDGNRTGVTRAGVTTAYAYDRADQLMTKTIGGGSPASFVYDAYGNLTTSQVSASGATTYAYNATDALTQIAPPGASNTVDFTLDALGRNRTRKVNSVLADTYGYLGESETVDLLTRSSGTIQSAISANSDRVAITQGSSFGWTLPDLHGSIAAIVNSASYPSSAITDAFRYDPYGELAASVTTGPSTPWRFNGNLLLTDTGTTDLYDGGARSYDPALAAFTQLDSVSGNAQNPFSMNRYAYAWGNPVGMVDPSGHAACVVNGDDLNPACQSSDSGSGSGSGSGSKHHHSSGSGHHHDSSHHGSTRSSGPSPYVSPFRSSLLANEARIAANESPAGKLHIVAVPHPSPAAELSHQQHLIDFDQSIGKQDAETAGHGHHPGGDDVAKQVDRSGPPSVADCLNSLSCSSDDFDHFSVDDRRTWLAGFDTQHESAFNAQTWHNVINDIFDLADLNGLIQSGNWFARVDDEILTSYQDGMALALGMGDGGTGSPSALKWQGFFLYRRAHENDSDKSAYDLHSKELWGDAEQTVTDYGVAEAGRRGLVPNSVADVAVFGAGNLYRSALANAGTEHDLLDNGLKLLCSGCFGPVVAANDALLDPRTRGPVFWSGEVLYGALSVLPSWGR